MLGNLAMHWKVTRDIDVRKPYQMQIIDMNETKLNWSQTLRAKAIFLLFIC